MRVVWTIHVLERLKQRHISRNEVITTLRTPDSKIKDRQGNVLHVKLFGDRALVVVARKEESSIVVITAYRTTRISRYLG